MKFSFAKAAALAAGLLMPFGGLVAPGWGEVALVQEAPRYRLGPGDRLSEGVSVDGFETNAAVLPDSTLNLPRIGTLGSGA